MPARPDFVLSAAEFDLLRGEFGLSTAPFPLEVPNLGATHEERAELAQHVLADLTGRGLADGAMLDGDLAALLRAVFQYRVSIDAVGHVGAPVCALVAADEHAAVRAELVEDQVWLTAIRPTALAVASVEVLPPAQAGPGRAVSIPQEALARAVDEEEDDDPFAGDVDDRTALIRAGVSAQDADLVTELADTRQAGGQFGVSLDQWRAPTVVSWFDTHQGRYLMVTEDGWVSIVGADNARIEGRVDRVLAKTLG